MEQRDGFEIDGRFYPWIQQMRLLDPLLVTEVTGMPYNEFLQRWQEMLAELDDGGDADMDPVVMNGLIAVAIWQQHTDWKRAKVVRFMERLSSDALTIVGEEDEEVEGEETVDPPLPAVNGSSGSGISSTTQSGSSDGQVIHSGPLSPVVTGTQG